MNDNEHEMGRLRAQVSSLKNDLEDYHEWLEEAIDQRDKFALAASWGIVKASSGIGAFLAFWYILYGWLELEGWIWGVVGGGGGILVYLLAFAWQESGQKKDEQKLHRLPEWKNRKADRL